MRVAFRVDASRTIGTGHVMRCLALGESIIDAGGTCAFVMRSLDGNMIEHVLKKGHTVFSLAAPRGGRAPARPQEGYRSWLEAEPADDAAETLAALEPAGPWDWLVVDHYGLAAEWERTVRPVAASLCAIDDLADRQHDADLLIDQNFSDDPHRYDALVGVRCERLLGPRYAVLRPEFAQLAAVTPRDSSVPVRKVLAFFGGVDATGVTLPALRVLETVRDLKLTCDVVVGRSNPRAEEISEWAAPRDWVRLHCGNVDLAKLMASSDLLIGAGGTTMLERSALGLPSVVLTIADNQLPGVTAAARMGVVLNAGAASTKDWQANLGRMLKAVLESAELRVQLSRRAAALVDGRGISRIISRLRRLPPTLRRAGMNDALVMHEWRNDPETRRYFRDPAPIKRADHFAWMEAKLADPACDLLIGEVGDDPVGVIRFDHFGDEAEVSLYLVPGHSGRGHGRRLLVSGVEWARKVRPATTALVAEVLAGNEASKRAFLAAGFELEEGNVFRYRLHEGVRS